MVGHFKGNCVMIRPVGRDARCAVPGSIAAGMRVIRYASRRSLRQRYWRGRRSAPSLPNCRHAKWLKKHTEVIQNEKDRFLDGCNGLSMFSRSIRNTLLQDAER